MGYLLLHGSRELGIGQMLEEAGYRFRPHKGDWIRHHGSGRFHVKPYGAYSGQLHYDLFVDGPRHFAPHMPVTWAEEAARIARAHACAPG